MRSKHLSRDEINKLLSIVSATRFKRERDRLQSALRNAAQYVRMSSEDQSYSIENQKQTIKEFARLHRLKIVRSYEDHGKSGVVLRGRSALQTLLSDVLSGEAPFSTVLVLDVSRWGRFIDHDEAACYEFLCRSAGVDVRYCAESFSSGSSFAGSISKSVKRLISTQFSHDLSKSVFDAKVRLARKGYWMGGPPPFGMQRVLLAERQKDEVLKPGEWKMTKDKHSVLKPGPSNEVRLIRTMFRMARRGSTCSQIAESLNSKGALFRGKRWSRRNVRTLLMSPVYTGTFIWGRTSEKLHGPITHVRREDWVCSPHELPLIVSPQTVEKVQAELTKRTDARRWCDSRIKEKLCELLHDQGRLSESVIMGRPDMPNVGTIRRHFGYLENAYAAIGYRPPHAELARSAELRRSIQLRSKIVARIVGACPAMTQVAPNRRCRPTIQLNDGTSIAIVICRSIRTTNGQMRWPATFNSSTPGTLIILLMLDAANRAIRFRYLYQVETSIRFHQFSEHDPLLAHAIRLSSMSQLSNAVHRLRIQHQIRPWDECRRAGL